MHESMFLLQYKIGQLYMIAKHSAEQSQRGEGVEVVENRPHEVLGVVVVVVVGIRLVVVVVVIS